VNLNQKANSLKLKVRLLKLMSWSCIFIIAHNFYKLPGLRTGEIWPVLSIE